MFKVGQSEKRGDKDTFSKKTGMKGKAPHGERMGGRDNVLALLPMKVTQLHIILPTLLSEKGGDRVELGLGLKPMSCNVNFILSSVDEIRRHHLFFPIVLRKIVYITQAYMALKSVAIGTTGGFASILPIPVNGFSPPRPQV